MKSSSSCPLLAVLACVTGCGSPEPPRSAPVAPEPAVVGPEVASPTPATAVVSSAPAAPVTSTTPEVAATEPSAAAPSAPPRHRATGPRLSAADRAAVTEHLREGRRFTREGQHAEALARFEAALALEPGAWRVECEAAFVAWRAESQEGADLHLQRAMRGLPPGFVPESQRVPTAMCLFNAGLIHEARGRVEQARDVWAESLRLRDNAAVRARLAALPALADDAPRWQSLPASTPIEELVAAMRADFCANGLAGFEGGSLEGCEDVALTTRHLGGAPGGLEAFHMSGAFPIPREGGRQLFEALVVRAGDVSFARVLGQADDAGLSASSTSLEVRASLEDVLPGGQLELVVHLSDWGGSTGEVECSGYSRAVIVCSTDPGLLRCTAFSTAEISSCSGDGDEETESVEEGYCRDPRFAEGRVTFARCPGASGDEAPFIDGVHEIRALLARGDIRWPDVWHPLEPVGS